MLPIPFLVQRFGYCDSSIVFVWDLERWSQNFLEGVAGMNLTGYNVTVRNMGSYPGGLQMDSVLYHCTDIEIKAQKENQTLHFEFEFIDSSNGSKLDWYIFTERLSSNLSSGGETLNESLLRAKQIAEAYRDMFNLTYCDELPSLILTALQNGSQNVEDQNALLSISHDVAGEMILDWYKKIGGEYTNQLQSIGMTISKNGLLTAFVDNLADYHVATTSIGTAQEALNISTPIAQAYANQHGQRIVSANATLDWMADSEHKRGVDDYAIYPVWNVFTKFDKTNDEQVDAYSATLWADNGQIAYSSPEGSRLGTPKVDATTKGNDGSFLEQSMIAALIVVLGFAGLATYLRHKTDTRHKGGRRTR